MCFQLAALWLQQKKPKWFHQFISAPGTVNRDHSLPLSIFTAAQHESVQHDVAKYVLALT
jgi:hypothetical protein